ncbi:MAG: hypothetical protein WAJ85_11550 [Candidatus Baltobacteraceae bacterium]|jgi:hypothetical protein
MGVTDSSAASVESPQFSPDETTAGIAAADLRKCARCFSMSVPEAVACRFCGQHFAAAARREAVTIALRATVIPMLLAAIGICIWMLQEGQPMNALFVWH